MKSVNGKLYIGGYFTSISDTIANYIAIWNGSKWGRLGSGLDDAPYSIEVGKTGLFVSGSFRKAGNINSSAIAKWRLEKIQQIMAISNLLINHKLIEIKN